MKKCVMVLGLPGMASRMADRLGMPLIAEGAEALMKAEAPFVTERLLTADQLKPYGYWPVVIEAAEDGMPRWERTKEGSFLKVNPSDLHEGTLYSWLHEELYS